MSKLEQQKLLSALNHDLTNVFFSVSVAGETSERYYKKLLEVYYKVSDEKKAGAEIPEKALQLLEKNLANIKHEMEFANFYLKSLRYNFCDYQNLSRENIDLAVILTAAQEQCQAIFSLTVAFGKATVEHAIVNAHKELLQNIMVRLFLLSKAYPLASVVLATADKDHILSFTYESEHMLQDCATVLNEPTLHLPEMKMAFNLSICYDYVIFMGGKVDLLRQNGQTCIKLYIPTVEANL